MPRMQKTIGIDACRKIRKASLERTQAVRAMGPKFRDLEAKRDALNAEIEALVLEQQAIVDREQDVICEALKEADIGFERKYLPTTQVDPVKGIAVWGDPNEDGSRDELARARAELEAAAKEKK